jgi:hypothetical protein
MAVILADLKREDREEYCNWWNWRPTIELLRQSELFDAERLEMMGCNGCAEVSEDEARSIAKFLDEKILPSLLPEERVMLDGGVTHVPDDGTFYRESAEHFKNYGASEDWLRRFAAFCRECSGFRVL